MSEEKQFLEVVDDLSFCIGPGFGRDLGPEEVGVLVRGVRHLQRTVEVLQEEVDELRKELTHREDFPELYN